MASVLLIEDDPAIADLMRVILEDEGHTILHVEQVPADLDPFKSQALDLIISDLQPIRITLQRERQSRRRKSEERRCSCPLSCPSE